MNKKRLTLGLVVALVATLLLSTGFSGPPRVFADDPTPTPTNTPTSTPTGSPTVTPTPGAIVITITPQISSLSCAASMPVNVSVKQGGNNVPDGTAVQLGGSQGSASPPIVLTAGGIAVFSYISPASGSGVVTLTAAALSTTSSTTISIFCGSGPPIGGPPPVAVQPAVLNQPAVTCQGSTASVVFAWFPAPIAPIPGVTIAYLDLTLQNNGFLPGTFLSAGPFDVTINQIVWNGILTGQPTYWRVNTLTAGSGWTTSSTGTFVPCASTAPPTSQISYGCIGNGTASVTFNWGQPASGFANYLDISLSDNGFAPATFIGTPVSGLSTYTWGGILANLPTFWRVNSLQSSGWQQTAVGSFVARC